ncbi:hypothetical protein NPIL_249791 [Nephila pilipes]|uniref:Uncharacterized protein n=1 Tax=Nephila pilipes TaxID=299642 RepID=A0A8X6PAV1_NEPPI|nr:hypothetical protein NPIL_249791 [Nephila pilipes]
MGFCSVVTAGGTAGALSKYVCNESTRNSFFEPYKVQQPAAMPLIAPLRKATSDKEQVFDQDINLEQRG